MAKSLNPDGVLDQEERCRIRQGVLAVRMLWFTFFTPILGPLLIVIGVNGAKRASAFESAMWVGSGVLLISIFAGFAVIYVRLLKRCRCRNCGWMLLRNPKSMGPSKFVVHSSCPQLPGRNAWSYQIERARKEGRIMCLRCGSDYEIGPSHLD
jgi:hypothetical protein